MHRKPGSARRIVPPAFAACLLAAACAVAVAAAGCGGGEPRPPVLRLAHVYEPAAPTHRCGAAPLAERVNASGTGMEVRVHPAAQLGSEAQLLEQLASGQLEMAIAGPSFLGMWHEPVGVFDAAFAFEDVDHLIDVADGPLAEPLWERLREEHGIRVLGTWYYGLRHITSNRALRTPDDLRGFRLRLPDARVWQESGRALGASPMPVAFAEVYLALQQGIADGQENPIPTIQAMGFHEVQRHLNLTGHIYSSTQVLIAERTWQRLTAEQQGELLEAVREMADRVRQCIEEDEERILAAWRDSGALQVVEDVDRDAFRRRAEAHFAEGFVFSDLYRRIRAMPSGDPR